ncbi:MAG: hypothetical protein JOY68_10125, partial [Candidatus Dormibacteraeota bacterium]|nr:hypothetical protein [Candidatus Dormibacteraeota bacterium]
MATAAVRRPTLRTAVQLLIVAAVAAFLGFLATQPATPGSPQGGSSTQAAATFPPAVSAFPGGVVIPGGGQAAPTSIRMYNGRPTHV